MTAGKSLADLPPILLAGCGKMGGAMLQAWLKGGLPRANIAAADPHAAPVAGVEWAKAPDSLTPRFGIVVFAVKPQEMEAALPLYRRFFEGGKTLALSIAAGKTTGFIEGVLGRVPVIRAMPNLPAVIGQGATAWVPGETPVPKPLQEAAIRLLSALGEVVALEDESLMDAVTAISGSGPAYVFAFMEALRAAALESGLEKSAADALISATMRGSVAYALENSDGTLDCLAGLRQAVTSKGGTTEAALGVFSAENGLQPLIARAVRAAIERSKKLNSQ